MLQIIRPLKGQLAVDDSTLLSKSADFELEHSWSCLCHCHMTAVCVVLKRCKQPRIMILDTSTATKHLTKHLSYQTLSEQ